MSQLLTTPAESTKIAIPSFVCRLTDRIGARAGGVDCELAASGSINAALDCQNLIDRSSDDEVREVEYVMDRTLPVCPMKVSTM